MQSETLEVINRTITNPLTIGQLLHIKFRAKLEMKSLIT